MAWTSSQTLHTVDPHSSPYSASTSSNSSHTSEASRRRGIERQCGKIRCKPGKDANITGAELAKRQACGKLVVDTKSAGPGRQCSGDLAHNQDEDPSCQCAATC